MVRNSLIALSLLALGACASSPSMDSSKAKPASMSKSESIRGEEVSYQAGGASLTGYMAWDESREGKRPGVLIVHEWWGHDDYVRKRADQLAAMGYTAFALDMYGDGKLADHPGDAKQFMMEVLGNMDAATARFRAAMDVLKKHPSSDPEQIAAIGYCFGGAVVLHMARFGFDIDGVASFHGNLATQSPAREGRVKARVLVLHGADDPLIPPEQVNGFKQEMEDAGVDYKFVAYAGAKHSFTNPAATAKGEKFNMPLAYDPAADRQSWAELDRFLTDLFGSQM